MIKYNLSNKDFHKGNLGYKPNGNLAIFDLLGDWRDVPRQCDYTMNESIEKQLRQLLKENFNKQPKNKWHL